MTASSHSRQTRWPFRSGPDPTTPQTDSEPAPQRLAGLLLTGGSSRRMGMDKAQMLVGGVPSAVRLHQVLARVVGPIVEVGPGVSEALSVQEPVPGSGPLAALAAGAEELRRRGDTGPALVVACDLPLLNEAVLQMLADWPGAASVVPVVGGRPQPLCARWAPAELRAAGLLVDRGERSMRPLWERPGVVLAEPSSWPPGVDPASLTDADTPEDLARLGFELPGPG